RSRIGRADLSRYTHLVMVGGSWNLPKSVVGKIHDWVEAGGVLLASKSAAGWAGEKFFAPEGDAESSGRMAAAAALARAAGEAEGADDSAERLPYGEARANAALSLIGGAIFQVEVDRTHPLGFGFPRTLLPVFKNSRSLLDVPDDPYVTVAAYTARPRLSGYASDENIEKIAGTPAVIARRMGRGTVVQLADNPSFRAFWHGTHRWAINALFFGGAIDSTASRFEAEHVHAQ
ncbi:MAG: peptidase, partial [Acidobacteriota bacterium]